MEDMFCRRRRTLKCWLAYVSFKLKQQRKKWKTNQTKHSVAYVSFKLKQEQ